MNVTVENLAPCKKLLRFDIDAQAVDSAFADVAKQYQKQAALPGFRPGKAPKDMVLKRYEKEIEDEAKRKLMGDSYRAALKDHKLEVVGYPDIEEIQFSKGQAMQFAATIETAPEFELPSYRGIVAQREKRSVTEEDIDKALKLLADRVSNFNNVEREAKEGDMVVVNYTGTADGKPLTELAPAAKGITEQKAFWVEVKPDSFIPGFAMQLVGARARDKRTVNIDFPPDFVTPQLAGLKGVYEVEVVEVKEKVVPALDDAFAKTYGAESFDALREGVRRDLQNELNTKQSRSVRGQIVKSLLDQVTVELPETLVAQETRNVVYQIVQENQQRGITKEAIDSQKDEIYKASSNTAKERVKASFVFQRIADKEGLRVQPEEANARIYALSQQYQMAPDKFAKELEKRNGIQEIWSQLLNEKVIDFLQQNAKIEDVEPAEAKA
ncbi:MAG TPA: trigger factor [Methylomirabilota bacterium]|nr:trigger factor [Methylomirabilota bacterium]